jgi:hypothetical protein
MRSLFSAKRGLFRDLFLGVALSALVFVCALAWGGPFLATQAQQNQAQHATFTGTVVRAGEQFVLREASGRIYRLDDPHHAQPFEGKVVKVTGTLDAAAHMIHVEQIIYAAA